MNAFSSEKRCPTSMAGLQICRGFKVHDLITCASKVQGHGVVALEIELESFIRPRALESFNQWHVTRSPPIRKRI